MSARFSLRGVSSVALNDLAMGPWVVEKHPGTAHASEPLSFTTGHEASAPPRWCVDLDSSDLDSAHAQFDRGERMLASTHAQLNTALTRLGTTLEAVRHPSPDSNVALDALESLLSPPSDSGAPVHFSAGDTPDDFRSREPRYQTRRALDHIARAVRHPSWVETRLRGQLVARSAISWTGDADNLVSRRLTSPLVAVHARSLTLSLRTRAAWTHLLVTVVHGSARLATLVLSTGPLGTVRALPMAWSFFRRVLADVNALSAMNCGETS